MYTLGHTLLFSATISNQLFNWSFHGENKLFLDGFYLLSIVNVDFSGKVNISRGENKGYSIINYQCFLFLL